MTQEKVGATPTAMLNEHAADTAERLNAASEAKAVASMSTLPLSTLIEIFDQPSLTRGAKLLRLLPNTTARKIAESVALDRLVDIFRQAPQSERDTLLLLIDAQTSLRLRKLLAYPQDSAGSIMTAEFVSVPPTATMADVLDQIRAIHHTRETIFPIYVVDPISGRLQHTVSLRRVITAAPQDRILGLCAAREPLSVTPLTNRKQVARLVARYDLLAIPVVDEEGRVLGIVTVDDVIDAIVAEGTEEFQRFGGVTGPEGPYLQIGFCQMIAKRAGWLCALFLSEMLTASAMQHFESELEKAVVLTLFIPLIMSSGGNSGSQATSLLIRALALGQLRLRDWWKIAVRELPVGVTLGVILGAIGMIRITAWQILHIYNYGVHWPLIALTVGLALVGIVTFGSMAGSMLPFVLKRLGFDPASASAPFVATLVDVTGLVIYFSVAIIVLHGTLL